MDVRAESMAESVNMATDRPSKLKIRGVAKKIESPFAAEVRPTLRRKSPSKERIRLSTDIDEQAYIRLKCYAAITRKPLVSALNGLIYTHCPEQVAA